MTGRFVIVGIGADGWPGLGEKAKAELTGARTIYGSRRQLDLLPELRAELCAWKSPMSTHLATLLDTHHAGDVHILASGDPMFHGVGATVARAVGPDRVRVLPAVSSASLACARLGWDLTDVHVVTTVARDTAALVDAMADGRDLLVLSRDAHTPEKVAKLLTDRGFGWSAVTVLEQLGGNAERIVGGLARTWDQPPGDPLNIVAVSCVGPRRPRTPGRPDDEYTHDGQLTKQPVRALTVSALAPGYRELLWDIGSGSGSVAIEWLRTEPTARAVAFERHPERARRLVDNATEHGVHDRLTVLGAVPDDLDGAPEPDAIFVGGGLDAALLKRLWQTIEPDGRLVVNAVTVDNQSLLTRWHKRHGGTLRRFTVETVEPLGSRTAWRPSLPIVQWSVNRV